MFRNFTDRGSKPSEKDKVIPLGQHRAAAGAPADTLVLHEAPVKAAPETAPAFEESQRRALELKSRLHDALLDRLNLSMIDKVVPEELRREVSAKIDAINQDPAFRKRLEDDGMAMIDIKYEDMPAFMDKMKQTYTNAAKSAGLVQ